MKNTIEINKNNIIWYFALIPFLFPRGVVEFFSGYMAISVLIIGIATFIIFVRELIIVAYSHWAIELTAPLMLILLYHIILLVITVTEQGTIKKLKLIIRQK